MKNIYVLIDQKEREFSRLQNEIEALKFVVKLLEEETKKVEAKQKA